MAAPTMLRAIIKAADVCAVEPERVARHIVEGPQPCSSGITGTSGSIGACDHAVRDGPGSARKSVI
jgi:hypothetical protein